MTRKQERQERGGGWKKKEGKESALFTSAPVERKIRGAKEKGRKARWSRQKTESGEKKIQQHSSLSLSCPCHQSPEWQLPYSHTHIHRALPAYTADSQSDESWCGMARHSTEFVRGGVFLLY